MTIVPLPVQAARIRRPTYNPRNLSVMSYAQSITFYSYHCADTLAEVSRAGYWHSDPTTLAVWVDGDTIIARCRNGTVHLALWVSPDRLLSVGVLGIALRPEPPTPPAKDQPA